MTIFVKSALLENLSRLESLGIWNSLSFLRVSSPGKPLVPRLVVKKWKVLFPLVVLTKSVEYLLFCYCLQPVTLLYELFWGCYWRYFDLFIQFNFFWFLYFCLSLIVKRGWTFWNYTQYFICFIYFKIFMYDFQIVHQMLFLTVCFW